MTERIHYFDFLRGLAIIGVIAIHSAVIGYSFNDTSLDFNLTVIWRQLINFSVPMYIAISGYFLANKDTSTFKTYLQFEKKQIPRVLLPYLLWSLLYSAISITQGVSLKVVILHFFTFQSSEPFYFILLIIEFYLLLPVLQKSASSKGLFLSALISVISCLFIFYFRYYKNVSLPLVIVGSAPSMLIFFVLGIYIRRNGIKIKNNLIILMMIFGLIFSLFETYALYQRFGSVGDSVTSVKVSSFLYSSFVILFAFNNASKFRNKKGAMVYLGEISFGIYLSHMFFIMALNSLINRYLPIINQSALIAQAVLISLTMFCCLVFALIARKIDKTKAVKYFGQ